MSDKNEDISGKLKKIILVLSILLACSVAGLFGVTVYKHLKTIKAGEVVVTDNIITPEEESGVLENASESIKQSPENKTANDVTTADHVDNGQAGDQAGGQSSKNTESLGSRMGSTTVAESTDGINITLYRRNAGENVLFSMKNMFPGDADIRYFRVKVSYKNSVTVRYHAEIRKGYEKLAEVLQTRVRLVNTDEVLYEGSMKDMPEKLNHLLNSPTETTDELCYEILTYLDTSVGNEYMNAETIVDFRWWVEEVENLTSPKTGEYYRMLAMAILAGVFAAGALFFLILKRREEEKDEQK